jgi:hypothetical protein
MRLDSLTRAVCLVVVAAGCTAAQPLSTPSATATAAATQTVRAVTSVPTVTPPAIAPGAAGVITGTLGYPSEVIPALRIYAIDPAAPGRYRVLHTTQNQKTYQIAGVAPGTYFVYASAYVPGQPDTFGGAYTRAVACGLGTGCTDHTPIPVQVRSGAVADGVDVRDWYAPPGTNPKAPTDREPFKSGDQVVVDNPQGDEVNARDAATLGGRILRTIPNGTHLTIQGGPTSAAGYDWYQAQVLPDSDVKLAFVAGFALRKR